jgi:hypothetical protein
MSNNRADMPSESVIRNYWQNNLDIVAKGFDSKCEFLDMNVCFACGMDYGHKLERAHIQPLCKGGSNDVSNLHCLCSYCHKASEYFYGDSYWEWFYERSFMDVVYQRFILSGANLYAMLNLKTCDVKTHLERVAASQKLFPDFV